jgi:glycosyltransferase involved in cell wall biosynthesis
LHEEKLVLDLVDMMKHLLDRVPSAHLTVVGDGPERDAFLQRAEALGVGGSISWKGAVPNDELLPFYLSADVFVSPFTGMALREAGACGTPIVAYATEAMTGVLVDGQNALLVPHGDTEGLAEAAAQLLSDPERRRALGVAFRETADQLWGRQHLERALHDSFDIPARHRRSSTRTILASVRGRLRPS